ncbi:MAG: hypothetical protein AAF790_08245, partial [Planctomycetota bacterium]
QVIFLLDDPADNTFVEPVQLGWAWLPRKGVGEHLELGAPQALFDGGATVRLPKIAREDRSLSQGAAAAYTAFDYKANTDGLVFSFERYPAAAEDSVDAQAILCAEQIESRTKIDGLVAFNALAGRQDLRVSDVVRGDYESGGRTVSRYTIYGVWRVDPLHFARVVAVVNAEVFTTEATQRTALETAMKVFASLRASEPEPAAPPSVPTTP